MDTVKLDRAEETLRELRAMAEEDSFFKDRECVVIRLRQLSAFEKELSGDSKSKSERMLCHQIKELVTDFMCAFLPVRR